MAEMSRDRWLAQHNLEVLTVDSLNHRIRCTLCGYSEDVECSLLTLAHPVFSKMLEHSCQPSPGGYGYEPEGLANLRTQYPHGHPEFIPRMLDIIKLHSDKNHDYALGGPPLGNFERTAQIMQLYPKFPWASDYGCAVVQMLKQLDAFMWQAQDSAFKPKVEGGDPRLRDITVFSQLIAIMFKRRL